MDDDNTHFHGPTFNIRRYAPPASSFTPEQHEEARRLGYPNAVERWVDRVTYEQWVDWRESVAWRAKNLFRRDLKSVGLGPQAFGALGRAWRGTTADGASGSASEEERGTAGRIPERLLEIQDRLEELGVSLDMEDSEVRAGNREEFRAIKAELDSIAVRMRDADVDGALREAANTPRPNPGAPLPEMAEWVTPNPELRRIYGAYDAEVAGHEAQQARLHGMTRDGSPCPQEVPDPFRNSVERILSRSNDEAGEEDEWDEDSRRAYPDQESVDEDPV